MDKTQVEEEIKKNEKLLDEAEDERELRLNPSGQHTSSEKIAKLSMEYDKTINELKCKIAELKEMLQN
ncbi:hypothetical protein FACS1894190_17890 [Spirochaetia bacterium]|nr:hypothetical protein FACS1894190_17890 [Spirochaetia bacterium]